MGDAAQSANGPQNVLNDLLDRYSEALLNYLVQPGEPSLVGAQRIGAAAIDNGLGLPEMAAAHHGALRNVLIQTLSPDPPAAGSEQRFDRLGVLCALLRSITPQESTAALRAAESFFAESVAPFEANRLRFEDATAALRHQNRRLEDQAGRIASALFDETLQLLAAANLVLHEIAGRLPVDDCGDIAEVGAFLSQIETQLAGFSHELRPAILDLVGLDAAVGSLAASVARMDGVEIEVDAPLTGRLPSLLATTLYRAIQEALANVSAHARATRVVIRIEGAAQAITCSIRDNGVGFEAAEVFSARGALGLGLIGIRENVTAVGGSFAVHSTPGNGTELLILVPEKALPN